MNWKLFDETKPEMNGNYLCANKFLFEKGYDYYVCEWFDGEWIIDKYYPLPVWWCEIIHPIVH